MTEKQIERQKLLIKKHRSILVAEKRKYGGFDDSAGRRYYIADLYFKMADYNGVITYKKWFNKNFPDDIGSFVMSLGWAIAYYELGKINEGKIYTIDTAFQNTYLHGFILGDPIIPIDKNDPEVCYWYESAMEFVKKSSKLIPKSYTEWLREFIETNEYKVPVQKYIELTAQLKLQKKSETRIKLLDQISELKKQCIKIN